MPNNDEIIAAYIREKKPELLDTLSFIIYAAMYRTTAAIKNLAEKLNQLGNDETDAELSDTEGTDEPERDNEGGQTE